MSRATERTWDVAIVGAGPSGELAAVHARRRGLSTLVVERDARVATYSALRDLGVVVVRGYGSLDRSGGLLVDGDCGRERVRARSVILATGEGAPAYGLGLEANGIAARDACVVVDDTQATSASHVWAVGAVAMGSSPRDRAREAEVAVDAIAAAIRGA